MKKFFGTFLLLLLTVSCLKTSKTVTLEQRVLTYWKIKEKGNYTFEINGKVTSLYFEYLSSKSKNKLSEKDFYNRLTSKISNVSIEDIKYIDNYTALVTMKYNLNYKGYMLKGIKIKEKWIKENNKWMIIINPKSNPFWKTKL